MMALFIDLGMEAILLEQNEDYLIFGNNKAQVQESDGRMWRTKEPAVLFFIGTQVVQYHRTKRK